MKDGIKTTITLDQSVYNALKSYASMNGITYTKQVAILIKKFLTQEFEDAGLQDLVLIEKQKLIEHNIAVETEKLRVLVEQSKLEKEKLAKQLGE